MRKLSQKRAHGAPQLLAIDMQQQWQPN